MAMIVRFLSVLLMNATKKAQRWRIASLEVFIPVRIGMGLGLGLGL
jgi:hypothetical protein